MKLQQGAAPSLDQIDAAEVTDRYGAFVLCRSCVGNRTVVTDAGRTWMEPDRQSISTRSACALVRLTAADAGILCDGCGAAFSTTWTGDAWVSTLDHDIIDDRGDSLWVDGRQRVPASAVLRAWVQAGCTFAEFAGRTWTVVRQIPAEPPS